MRKILFVMMATMFFAGCREKIKWDGYLAFPDNISPVYYVDTIQIKSPYIAILDSIPYVLPEKSLNYLRNGKALETNEMVSYYIDRGQYGGYLDATLPRKVNSNKLGRYITEQRSIDLEYITYPYEVINGVQVLQFQFQPKCFVLALMAPVTKYIGFDDQISDILYSTDYALVVAPVFNKRDHKVLRKKVYESINGEVSVSNLGIAEYLKVMIWIKYGVVM